MAALNKWWYYVTKMNVTYIKTFCRKKLEFMYGTKIFPKVFRLLLQEYSLWEYYSSGVVLKFFFRCSQYEYQIIKWRDKNEWKWWHKIFNYKQDTNWYMEIKFALKYFRYYCNNALYVNIILKDLKYEK